MMIFRKPLVLDTGKGVLTIYSTYDFDFALAGRTNPSTAKVSEFMVSTSNSLKADEEKNTDIVAELTELLVKGIKYPNLILPTLKKFKPDMYTADNNWRPLITTLIDKGDDYIPLIRVALLNYVKYLQSCNQTITTIISSQPDNKSERNSSDPMVTDVTRSIKSSDYYKGYTRINKNSPFILVCQEIQSVELLMAVHSCQLIVGDVWQFVDPHNNSHTLQTGRHIIGRDPLNDIVMDASLTDISRVHLFIELLDNVTVRFLDVSLHGTFIPSGLLF